MRRLLVLIALLCTALFAACTAAPTPVPIRLLDPWQPQADTLTVGDAVRAWHFNGQQGDAVRLRLDAKSAGAITLTLQDEAGNTLAQGDDFTFTLPAAGVYSAFVHLTATTGGESGVYSLTLSYADRGLPSATPTASDTPTATFTPTATPTPSNTPTETRTPTPIYAPLGTLSGRLQVGVTAQGAFLSEFERQIYTFSGATGQTVTIEMVGVGGSVDPVLTLFDPAGQPLATDDNSGGDRSALLRDIHLPADGDYFVQAIGGGTGGYQISLEATAPPPPIDLPTATAEPPLGRATPAAALADNPLIDHVLVSGGIDHPGAFARYFINAQGGDILTIGAYAVDSTALHVEFYNPAGELMITGDADPQGQVLIPGIGVLQNGTYSVFISQAANYVVGFGRGMTYADFLRGTAPPDSPLIGGDMPGYRDLWWLTLSAGDVAELSAPGAHLRVIAPDGSSATEASDTLQITAAQTGEYRIYGEGTNYLFRWHYITAVPTAPPPVLILSADDPLPPQTYLYYPFQGESGRRIHVRVEALDASFDPVAALLDPDGNEIASGDDSEGSLNPDFEALLPADGTYTLRVNGYGDSAGSVSIRVEVVS